MTHNDTYTLKQLFLHINMNKTKSYVDILIFKHLVHIKMQLHTITKGVIITLVVFDKKLFNATSQAYGMINIIYNKQKNFAILNFNI